MDLPELPPTESMHEVWHDLGRHGPRGAFDWSEIRAYVELTGADLPPFQARTLRDMSQAYADGLADTDPLSVAPMERGRDRP